MLAKKLVMDPATEWRSTVMTEQVYSELPLAGGGDV
jgi:hypothetical protein